LEDSVHNNISGWWEGRRCVWSLFSKLQSQLWDIWYSGLCSILKK